MLYHLDDTPAYETPEIGSDIDKERFFGNFDDLELDELIDHAKSLGIGVRSTMKRETVLNKLYSEFLAREGVEDAVDSVPVAED